MQLKYLACAFVGAASFCFAAPAIAAGHDAKIWAITGPISDGAGHDDVDLYSIDMKTHVYQKVGRLPRTVGTEQMGPGHWSGLAVRNHNLYFCTKDRFISGMPPSSEMIAQLDTGDTNNIHVLGGFVQLKKVGDVGFLADICGMCAGPDGNFYFPVIFTTLNSPQLPQPDGDISALFRFDSGVLPPAKVVGWFKDTKHVGGYGENAFYCDLDFQPGTGDLYGMGLVHREPGQDDKTAIYRIDRSLYPLFTGVSISPPFDFVKWFDMGKESGGLSFSQSTGALYITEGSSEVFKYDPIGHKFDLAYRPLGIDPGVFKAIKVEDGDCCECPPNPPRPPHCRWYIPRLHICLDYMFPVYAQMIMLEDLADTARALDPAVGRDVEISNLQAIKKLADQRIVELMRPPRPSKGARKMRRK